MDYKTKYLKYKSKYINLKNMYGGLYKDKEDKEGDIFDLDFILPLTKENEKYFFDDKYRFSKDIMYRLRFDLQQFYSQIYYYLLNPNIDFSKYNQNRFELIIPIKNENTKHNERELNIGKVNYKSIQDYLTKPNNQYYYILLQIINDNIDKIKEISNQLKSFINDTTELKHNFSKSEIDQIDFLYDTTKIYIINTKLINLIKIYKDNMFSSDENTNIQIFTKLIEYVKQINDYRNINVFIYQNFLYETTKKKLDLLNKLLKITIDKTILNDPITTKFITDMKDINKQNKYILYDNLSGINLINIDYIDLIENKQKEVCNEIIKKFEENHDLKIQILNIQLRLLDENIDEIGDISSHANAILIYKFKKNKTDTEYSYLCLRTEPHRHSNTYCRNSVRKAIRDICKNFPNSYYLDYIIDSKIGLQDNEDIADDIERRNMYDYYNIPKELRQMSPLQGSSGFCATWTLYIIMILILNKDKKLDEIGKYFADFNSKYIEKGKIKSQFLREKYDTLCKPNKNNQECQNIIKEIKEYFNVKQIDTGTGTRTSYVYPNEKSDCDYAYIIMKHIKLYRIILFALYLLSKKNLIDKSIYVNQNQFVDEIFVQFDDNNILDQIKQKLNIQLEIDISQDILDKDRHKCDDNLFEHNEFCNIKEDKSKEIPNPDINNCNNSHLKKDNTIILDSIAKNIQKESQSVNEKTKENADYLIKEIIQQQ